MADTGFLGRSLSRRLTVALLVLALVPGLGAQGRAATTIETASDRPFQRWASRARVPTPDAIVTVAEEPCPFSSARACTYEGSFTIWIDPRAGRQAFLHELGHQFDYLEMDDPERDRFRRLINETRAWRSPPDSPHELFAEAYRLCASRSRLRRPPSLWSTGFRPIVERFRQVCRLIRRSYTASEVVGSDDGPGDGTVVGSS